MKKITLQLSIIAFLFLTSSVTFAQFNFSASPNQGCAPLPVTFTNTSVSGSAYRYEWKFNDGSPSLYDTVPISTVTHTFTSSGWYNVSFTAYDITGAYLGYSYGSSGNIQVNGAGINAPDSACRNDVISFCANSQTNSCQWNFGDGNISSDNGCVNHAYTTSGTYTVTLTANTSCGNQTVTKLIVIANAGVKPWPGAWANINTSCPAVPINFNTGTYSAYSWNFGDPASGANNTSNQQSPPHTYATAGTYTATLTVTNTCGLTATATTTVSITNTPAFPNQSWFKLDINSSPSCPNSNVSFNAPNGYSNYEWNFGDGSPLVTTSNNYNNHTYGSAITNYTVSVRVISACGNDTTLSKTLVINNSGYFPTQNFQLNANSPSCPDSYAGFEAPGGYQSYEWNFGDGSPLVTSTDRNESHKYGAALTMYTVTVRITNGCNKDTTISKTVQIMNGVGFPTQNFSLNTGPNPACPGDNVNWNAPGGYVKYEWSFGDGDSAVTDDYNVGHTYTTAATYNGSVKITNGCGRDTTINSSVTVNNSGTFPNELQIEANSTACPDEYIEFRLNQKGYQTYSWNFGDGSPVYIANVEKTQHAYTTNTTYTVTCQITNGCSNTTTVTKIIQITNNSPVNNNLTIKNVQNPSCPGDKVFFIVEEGGQSNYEYIWNFGDTTPLDTTVGSGTSHIYTTGGTYNVSVFVTNGCEMTKTINFTQTVGGSSFPTLSDGSGHKNWGFPGGEDGSNQTAGCAGDAIIFYFAGAAADNLWDFGDSTSGKATESMVVYGGDGGSYPVTIIKHAFATNGSHKIKLTLTNGCGNSVTDSMTIGIGGSLLVNGEMTTSPPPFATCAAIDFLAFGGSEFDWDFGDGTTLNSTSPTVSHTFAAQGDHLVSVVITNGCGNSATYSKIVNVNGAGGPAITLNSSILPTCIGSTNGSATVSVTSGNPPYIYSWNDANAQTSATATGLAAGLYDVTVTDVMGCASVLAVSINNPAPAVFSFSKTNAGCGLANGTATVSPVSGGTAPFSYLWSTGETGITATGLAAGAYSVVSTDFKGCTYSSNVSISENGGATLALNTVTNVSCNGASTGAIDLNVSGANPPYIYLWSNGSTVQDPGGLIAGNYSVQVLDNNGCKSILNTSLTQPALVVAATSVLVAPTCGKFDGTAIVTPSGGTGPYTCLWDPGAGTNVTTQSAAGLPAGSYTVTVTDIKGCTMEGEISLSNSNAPNITANITDVSCYGLSNGTIDITVTGGTSPYLYNWSVPPPNANKQDLTAKLPGDYFLSVNDAKGCSSYRLYTIAQPAVLTTSVTGTGANCNSNNGTVTANTTGGNVPYTYVWTGGKTTQTATGLALGDYTVTVTDIKGCTTTAVKNIASAAPTPSLCMVTVDAGSVNNIIYWDKTQYQHIDSFIVYREVSTSVYKRIGALKDTALSEFVDVNRSVGPANGDPNVGSYRYKLQLRDSCGNYSALSPYHNTIYIMYSGSGQFDWNLPYTIEGGANPVANYNLICDSANAENWFQTGVVAGTQSSAGDPDFVNRPVTARWRVNTDWSISCTPTRAGIITTRSNIKHAGALTTLVTEKGSFNNDFILYPNPATSEVTIKSAGLTSGRLQIFDALGQLVYDQAFAAGSANNGTLTKTLNTSSFPKGVYIVNMQTENGNAFKRLVIQ